MSVGTGFDVDSVAIGIGDFRQQPMDRVITEDQLIATFIFQFKLFFRCGGINRQFPLIVIFFQPFSIPLVEIMGCSILIVISVIGLLSKCHLFNGLAVVHAPSQTIFCISGFRVAKYMADRGWQAAA
ncbi:hypothetical protein DSECCO2_629170 [anaerobic digester metagenome]